MSKYLQRFFFLCGCLFAIGPVWSQNAVNSVYSRFGLGLDSDPGTGPQIGMGNAGSALRSPILINPVNPASLSAISITTFQTGLMGERLWQRTAADTAKTWRGGFAFLNLGFKCNKGWGMALGLQPVYSMGFNAESFSSFEGQTIRNYQSGSGGLNKAYFMQGFSPLKWFFDSLSTDLAIGGSADVLFGNYERFRFMNFIGADTSMILGRRVLEEMHNKSLTYSLGAQITQEFGKKTEDDLRPIVMVLGFSYRPEHRLPFEYTSSTSMFRVLSSGTQAIDTISSVSGERFNGKLPGEWRAGWSMSYLQHFVICYDYSYSNRATLLAPWGAGESGERIFHRGGLQYYPGRKSDRSYFKHTYYRLGFRTGQTGIIAGGRMVKEQALNAGVGIKLGKKTFSTLNLSLEAGQRGNLKTDALRESWIQLHVGIVLNDANWFIKRKFD